MSLGFPPPRQPWTEAYWRFLSRVWGLSSNVMMILLIWFCVCELLSWLPVLPSTSHTCSPPTSMNRPKSIIVHRIRQKLRFDGLLTNLILNWRTQFDYFNHWARDNGIDFLWRNKDKLALWSTLAFFYQLLQSHLYFISWSSYALTCGASRKKMIPRK